MQKIFPTYRFSHHDSSHRGHGPCSIPACSLGNSPVFYQLTNTQTITKNRSDRVMRSKDGMELVLGQQMGVYILDFVFMIIWTLMNKPGEARSSLFDFSIDSVGRIIHLPVPVCLTVSLFPSLSSHNTLYFFAFNLLLFVLSLLPSFILLNFHYFYFFTSTFSLPCTSIYSFKKIKILKCIKILRFQSI